MPIVSTATLRHYGDPHPRRRIHVLDSVMSYVDVGQGRPIVFLHGNPTWSYVWRNIIPHAQPHGRCLAPDLIGMGLSAKSPSGSYRFQDQARYLDAWFESLALEEQVVLVSDDWGTALAAHWANRNRSRVGGFVYMEGVIRPSTWADYPEGPRRVFQALRSEEGRRMVIEKNAFVEDILPRTVVHPLSPATMAGFRAPYLHPEDREAMLAWHRELPIEGSPADVVDIVKASGDWLSKAPVPKLLIVGSPGAALTGEALSYARSWSHQEEVTVTGAHVLQEDSPHEVGKALSAFLQTHGNGKGAGS